MIGATPGNCCTRHELLLTEGTYSVNLNIGTHLLLCVAKGSKR